MLKLFHRIHLAHRALFRTADRELTDRYGITTAQHGVLLFLERNSGASAIELAEAVGLRRAATSGLLERMEAKGLIIRVPSSKDKRSLALSLSAKGEDILAETKPLIKQANKELLAGFNGDEQAVMERVLKAIETRANAGSLFDKDTASDQALYSSSESNHKQRISV
ncbi:MarR family winged helix-turn-helix transcriptional regulator [Kordiimonas sp. SCSIO 12610]|uniref:MarR family winged helix-turn-helix transcriptional regulator n=1 Tax=Kordiimonas sp. SCSIO 12610 TaxID=2829597 RepID=UPI00210DA408|nr:MarR family transcriptional regulator [Kordiimonas sp. SCSIO 12610]UTW56351.1 MarR family transcriptional regulator [Kordiimonas sp. SCSIO 12610]